MKVLKFGGTSLATGDRIRRVVEIIRASLESHHVVVVASAAGSTTDALVELASAGGRKADVERLIDRIRRSHLELADAVLTARRAAAYGRALGKALEDVKATANAGAIDARRRDRILAAGERLSVPMLALALRDAGVAASAFDATTLIRTDDTFGEARVQDEVTEVLVREWFARKKPGVVGVVTGYIGATEAGEVTTLGRGGSDYSAALLARALRADALERWTDVDGLYTDDPRTNRRAKRWASIRLSDALSRNHAGRLGMHRRALDPLMAASIPVYVRSTLAPDHPGTVILPEESEPVRTAV